MAQWNKDNQEYLSNNGILFEAVILADKDGNVGGSAGNIGNIGISDGTAVGKTDIHKFGYMDGNASSPCTLWSPARNIATSLYPWDTAANFLDVSSDGSEPEGAEIRIQGLDSNYDFLEEDVAIGSISSNQFFRTHRAFVIGSSGTNVGNIAITSGGTLVGEIPAGFGQTLQAIYTIPAGKSGYLLTLEASCSKNQSSTFVLFTREFGGSFRASSTISLFQNNGDILYDIPIFIPEKTDIDLRVIGGTNQTASGDFDILLVDNPVV